MKAALQAWWARLAVRERRALLLAAGVVGVWLVWRGLVLPPWNVLAQAPAEHQRLDAEVQTMQHLQRRARQVQAMAQVPRQEVVQALQRAVVRAGPGVQLQVHADRAELRLQSMAAADLQAWLPTVLGAASGLPAPLELQWRADGAPGDSAATTTSITVTAAPGAVRWSGRMVFALPTVAGGAL